MPPASACFFSPDRKGEHPRNHLADFRGVLQGEEGQQTVRGTVCPTNAYTGFAALYEPEGNSPPRIREAACWAHLRRVRDRLGPVAAGRSLFDVHKETGSGIAQEALRRIGELYDIEARISGQSAEARLAVRRRDSKPKVEAFKVWAEEHLGRIPGKSDLARAFRYGLSRWASFCLFLDDGRVGIDSAPLSAVASGA